METRIKRAAVVVGAGLAVQLAAAFYWSPATFIAAAAVGTPLVLVGGAMFLAAVWKTMKDKGAV